MFDPLLDLPGNEQELDEMISNADLLPEGSRLAESVNAYLRSGIYRFETLLGRHAEFEAYCTATTR